MYSVVDLFAFCGIFASFLDWISFSVTVMIPRPESSLSINRSVERSSVRKLKLSTACSLSAQANEESIISIIVKTIILKIDPFCIHPLVLLISGSWSFLVLEFQHYSVPKNLAFLQTERRAMLETNFSCLLKKNHFDHISLRSSLSNVLWDTIQLLSMKLYLNQSYSEILFCYFEPMVILSYVLISILFSLNWKNYCKTLYSK